MQLELSKSVLMIVAHPDDETLWAGGTLLSNPSWECFVLCLCRGSDSDRAPKFQTALNELGSTGVIADLDDGPNQRPLDVSLIESEILKRLPSKKYDLIITHSPQR
jgi:LmbE family N-acetylglucosaminyl deacetylase